MDRTTLKRTLQEQVIPLEDAVRQKIKYLLSDEVFAPTAETTPTDDDVSFTEAFGNVAVPAQASYQTAAPTRKTDQPSSPLQEKVESFAEHKQSMAEKIAALRGISNVSATYSRHKNQ